MMDGQTAKYFCPTCWDTSVWPKRYPETQPSVYVSGKGFLMWFLSLLGEMLWLVIITCGGRIDVDTYIGERHFLQTTPHNQPAIMWSLS